jgi:glycosyltransferase involved in cell wall biosynthesis
MPSPRLSVVVVARDEAEMIGGCLARLGFADEVLVVVDDRTLDETADRAAALRATVHHLPFTDFSQFKNAALDRAGGDWVMIVDADERVSARLADEVRGVLDGPSAAYRVRIENWFFAGRMRDSGWRERPIRLFRRDQARYRGEIHETLVFHDTPPPPIRLLQNGLAHFSHRSIGHNLAKTQVYADIQAREMLASGHPPVTARTFARVLAKGIWRHTVAGRGFRDGMPGIIECIYQPFSIFTVYVRLWELQQEPSLEQRYHQLEDELP